MSSDLDSKKFKLTLVVLAVISAAYLLQMFSPLRLNSDSITFLSVAVSAADGEGFVWKGELTRYPLGYLILLVGLDRVGLGASWAFVGLNCLFLGLGVFASYFIYIQVFKFDRWVATLLCCLMLLCHVFVRQVAFPMSDISFFGVAMA